MAKQIPLQNLSKSLKKLYAFLNAAANFINDYDEVTVSASASTADLTVYQTKITTGGVGRVYNLGNGSGAVVGQRKLVKVTAFTASDTVILDHANIVTAAGVAATAVVLDALNEFILVEWNGAKWQAVHVSSGVITTA